MSAKTRILSFVAFWTFMGLLVHFGNRGADHVLIAIWFTVLIVGSVIVVFRRWPAALREDDTGRTHYLGSLLPRRWRYWLMGETAPEDSRGQRKRPPPD